MLVEQGWSLAAASSTTSIVLWLTAVSVPLGGMLADRSGRPEAVVLGGFLAFCVLLVLATRTDAVVPTFVALGLLGGLPAGAIMSLPARVLAPEKRASGMGLFYTLFYAFVVLAPWIGGWLASQFGTARVTFDLGAAALLLGCVAMLAFQRLAARVAATRVDAAGAKPAAAA
jgi:MFS family permease